MKRNFFYYAVPEDVRDVGWSEIQSCFTRQLYYASLGRFGIYHILKSIDDGKLLNKQVMLPVYACNSITWAVLKAGFIPVYYDIDAEDLNPDVSSIKEVYYRTSSKVLLCPSLYGNPANLIDLEEFCKENEIILIDDAAQAFGARLENRVVGGFGDAGLFSFSAGKPTFGHMGCYFWTKAIISQNLNKTRHRVYHWLSFVNFFFNRYADYNFKKLYRIAVLNYIQIFLFKILDLSCDGISQYERKILHRIAISNFKGISERSEVMSAVDKLLLTSSQFRLVKSIRGIGNNNKIVLIADSVESRDRFIAFFHSQNLWCTRGYKLLDEIGYYPTAKALYNRVIEIPIVMNKERNQRTVACLNTFLNSNN